jgi:hypothetical protein
MDFDLRDDVRRQLAVILDLLRTDPHRCCDRVSAVSAATVRLEMLDTQLRRVRRSPRSEGPGPSPS